MGRRRESHIRGEEKEEEEEEEEEGGDVRHRLVRQSVTHSHTDTPN